MEPETVLAAYCKVSDFDPTTGVCAQVFFGPSPSFLPAMTAAEGVQVSGIIIGVWFVGFLIQQARRPLDY